MPNSDDAAAFLQRGAESGLLGHAGIFAHELARRKLESV
jgi:hypothetical protein